MAFVATDSTSTENRASSIGPVKIQFMDYSALPGDTSGTVTADELGKLFHVFMFNSQLRNSAAPTYSGNVATLTFTVPSETAASKTIGGVTYTATANQGAGGNSITVAYTGGATAGSEVVTVSGLAISVQIQSGVSTVTQVRTAVEASGAATALVTATGTSASTVSTTSATALSGGVTGGAQGQLICIGR